jgi:AcrR family transcriptional regulator
VPPVRRARSRPPDRRRRILEAALRCFARRGFAATTIEDIRRASGASTGSLYHHFGSKEELAGALYLEGLRDYHRSLLEHIRGLDDAEALVKGMVSHYVAWVADHPDWARYLLEMRRTESVRAVDREIRALTRLSFGELARHLDPLVRRGSLSKLSLELHAAIVTGPAQTLAAHFVPQRRLDELRAAAPVLAEAAWRALREPF